MSRRGSWYLPMTGSSILSVFRWLRHNCAGPASVDNFCILWSRILRVLFQSAPDTAIRIQKAGDHSIRKTDAMRRAPLGEDICQTMLHTDLLVDQFVADEATKSWRSSARMPLVPNRLVGQVTVCPPFSSPKCFPLFSFSLFLSSTHSLSSLDSVLFPTTS